MILSCIAQVIFIKSHSPIVFSVYETSVLNVMSGNSFAYHRKGLNGVFMKIFCLSYEVKK
jgi:hypothetical protein